MNWQVGISLLLAFAGLIVAIVKLVDDAKRSRFQAGVTIMLRFVDQFESPEMCEQRKKAASAIKISRGSQTFQNMKDADEILDFFETIAFLAKKKGVDKEFVWHTFYYWMHRYFLLCQGYIFFVQKTDKARWEDLCWLHAKLNKIELSKAGRQNDLKVEEKGLLEFIEDERA